jgi:predicted DCC family thiol-disulfide oxidoreductase YuxK
MDQLIVLYDQDCGLCCRVRRMLEAEPQYVPIEFLASVCEEARSRYPTLAGQGELVAIDDAGGVYEGTDAYLITMYCSERFRPLSLRLGSPLLKPLARQAFAALGHSRRVLSGLLGWRSDSDLARELGREHVIACEGASALRRAVERREARQGAESAAR